MFRPALVCACALGADGLIRGDFKLLPERKERLEERKVRPCKAVSYSPKYCPIGKIHVTQSHSPLFCHGRCQVAAQKFKRRLVTKTRDPADDVSVPVVEVIEPKRVSFMFTFGLLKLGWFSALIESIRN